MTSTSESLILREATNKIESILSDQAFAGFASDGTIATAEEMERFEANSEPSLTISSEFIDELIDSAKKDKAGLAWAYSEFKRLKDNRQKVEIEDYQRLSEMIKTEYENQYKKFKK